MNLSGRRTKPSQLDFMHRVVDERYESAFELEKSMTIYAGQCHCGAIGFRFLTAMPPSNWAIRACQRTTPPTNSRLDARCRIRITQGHGY